MTNKWIKIGLLILFMMLGLFIIYQVTNDKTTKDDVEEITDAVKFKNEYEALNGKTSDSNKTYLEVSIDEDNSIKYTEIDEILNIIENKTGVIYFGFPECPWCRNIVPVLIEAALEFGINNIYYYNPADIRDKKHLDEAGNIVVDNEGTAEYKKLVEDLYDYLGVYEGLNDDSIKRLYVPTVVFVKDGKIVNVHIGTVDSQTDPYVALTTEQREELKTIYSDNIAETYDLLCDKDC